MQSIDIAIIGGGMIGLALACGLEKSGLRIVVLEQNVLKMQSTNMDTTLRFSAINAATEKLLRYLNVWSDIIKSNISCYHSVEVWDKDSFGHIIFNDDIFGYSHLGYIIDNVVVRAALWKKVRQCANVILLAPAQLQQIAWGENEVFITLKNGDMLTARLVVGADGSKSWLRSQAKIPLTFFNYGHHALVAIIQTIEPHGGVARQIFHNDGILAFLPLTDANLCSIVWSLPPDHAQKMRDADPKLFNQEICMAFDNRLGLCSLKSKCQMFPLIGQYANHFVANRLVLIGDAAHTIHPLAGQGVNLGFMDVAQLIEELSRLHNEGKDIGQLLYLRRYERNRKYNAAMIMSGIYACLKLFSGSHPAKKLIRNVGLTLADILPGVKHKLLRQAMGLNDLPNWLR